MNPVRLQIKVIGVTLLMMSDADSNSVFWVVMDLSGAFDKVDHNVLIFQ